VRPRCALGVPFGRFLSQSKKTEARTSARKQTRRPAPRYHPPRHLIRPSCALHAHLMRPFGAPNQAHIGGTRLAKPLIYKAGPIVHASSAQPKCSRRAEPAGETCGRIAEAYGGIFGVRDRSRGLEFC